MFGVRCHDDLGEVRRLPLESVSRAAIVWCRRLPRLTFLRAIRQGRRIVLSSAFLIAIGLAALLIVTIRVAVDEPGVGLWFLVFSPVYTALFAIGVVIVRAALGIRGGLPDWTCAMLLSERRCPICSYTLLRNHVGDDQCVGCPECGAGWLAKRIGAAPGTLRETVIIAAFNRPTSSTPDTDDPRPENSTGHVEHQAPLRR